MAKIEKLYSTREAARLLGMDGRSLREMIRAGAVPARRFEYANGSRTQWKITESTLAALQAGGLTAATADRVQDLTLAELAARDLTAEQRQALDALIEKLRNG